MTSPQLGIPPSATGQHTETEMAEQPEPSQQPLVLMQTLPAEHPAASRLAPASAALNAHDGRHAGPCGAYCAHVSVAVHFGAASLGIATSPDIGASPGAAASAEESLAPASFPAGGGNWAITSLQLGVPSLDRGQHTEIEVDEHSGLVQQGLVSTQTVPLAHPPVPSPAPASAATGMHEGRQAWPFIVYCVQVSVAEHIGGAPFPGREDALQEATPAPSKTVPASPHIRRLTMS
jgi:hypothetical protein